MWRENARKRLSTWRKTAENIPGILLEELHEKIQTIAGAENWIDDHYLGLPLCEELKRLCWINGRTHIGPGVEGRTNTRSEIVIVIHNQNTPGTLHLSDPSLPA